MKRALPLYLLLLIGLPTFSLAGDIQVLCEPGLKVYLDGEFMGISNAKEDGLFLPNVPTGEHVVRVEKEGFSPRSFTVRIGLPVEVRVGEFTSEPEAQLQEKAPGAKVESLQEGEGSLRVISTPMRCTVRFLGKTREKTSQRLNLSHIPAGEHSIEVSWRHLKLSRKIRIIDGQRTVVRISFMKGDEPFIVSHEPM